MKLSAAAFFWRFLGFLAVFQLLFVVAIAPSAAFLAYLRWTTYLSGRILMAFGSDVHVDGNLLLGPIGGIEVKSGCDAVQPTGFFLAAVLAYPAPWRWKWIAIGVGPVLMLVLNQLRIISLFLLSSRGSGAFELAHEVAWPAAFILFALLLWVLWLHRVGMGANPHPR